MKLRVRVDDLAELYGPPCVGSNRDDPYVVKEFLVNVVLPEGCEEGSASFNVNINTDDLTTMWCEYIDPACGALVVPEIDCDVNVVYNNCNWAFQVDIDINILYGVCGYPGVVDIATGSDPFLTASNYCDIVTSMRSSTVCLCVGNQRVTASTCAQQHEDKHLYDYVAWFNSGIEDIKDAIPDGIAINCADANTITCQAVKGAYEGAIEAAVMAAHQTAYNYIKSPLGELGAIVAARECFNGRADTICTHAQSHEWPSCDACGGSEMFAMCCYWYHGPFAYRFTRRLSK